ncbi:MAG: hypothetical protein ACON3Z_03960 [Bradymonadia bacterium]
MIVCPSCEHENEVGTAFCIACGHDFTLKSSETRTDGSETGDAVSAGHGESHDVNNAGETEGSEGSQSAEASGTPERDSTEVTETVKVIENNGSGVMVNRVSAEHSAAENPPELDGDMTAPSAGFASESNLDEVGEMEEVAKQNADCEAEDITQSEEVPENGAEDEKRAEPETATSLDNESENEDVAVGEVGGEDPMTHVRPTSGLEGHEDSADEINERPVDSDDLPADLSGADANQLNVNINPLAGLPPAPAVSAVSPLQFSDFGEAAFGSRWWLKPTVKVNEGIEEPRTGPLDVTDPFAEVTEDHTTPDPVRPAHVPRRAAAEINRHKFEDLPSVTDADGSGRKYLFAAVVIAAIVLAVLALR